MICNCFGTNILNWGTQIYATVSEQISGWQIFTEFWHNITFTKRRLLGRTSPCQGELLHPESSNVSNGDEESRWEWCVEKTSVLLRVASLTCPREKPDSNGKHTRIELASAPDIAWMMVGRALNIINFYSFSPKNTFAFWAGRLFGMSSIFIDFIHFIQFYPWQKYLCLLSWWTV